MTNAQILDQITVEAIEAGTIENGESLHTFQYWKQCGYSVRKGEHAKAVTKLWKRSHRKNDEEEEETDSWFLAKSFLFSSSQVEKLQQN